MTSSGLALPLPLTGSRVSLEEAESPGAFRIHRLADDILVGRGTLAGDSRALHVDELIIEEPYRGYGAGSEAAHLLIDAAGDRGFDHITAWAPPHLGLAVYFWYRMGLRALHGPGPGGGILFERILKQR